MPSLLKNASFLRGMRHGLPFVVVVVPFALLFGVVGTEAGLTASQSIAFSVLVIAGASQFAAVAQMVEQAPVVIVLATALAVNLRMAMYSAALAPAFKGVPRWQRMAAAYGLVDQSYLLSALEFERRPDLSPADRIAYFFGNFAPIALAWYGAAVVGAVAGSLIPPSWALDFVMPIAFLGMMSPAIRTWAHGAAAITSAVLALALAGLPYGLGLIVAAIAALIAGSLVELWRERRA